MRNAACLLLILLPGAAPQQMAAPRPPYIGYAFPAGGQQGTTFDVKIGGENVYGSTAAIVSGKGVTVEVTDSRDPNAGNVLFKKRKKANQTVIDEIVKLKVAVAPDAEPGARDLCLVTPTGLSNKRTFLVDQLKEASEDEAGEKKGARTPIPPLPAVVNGQIMPGDADAFRFSARKGQQLVVEVYARALIPYIADAVPGWFQAVVSLQDAQGKEVAYADDFRFNPDPVLFYDVPADGEYGLAIRDSIYRGREDFVYRIRVGELPFITGVFPLGAPRGEKPVTVKLAGKNLPADTLSVAVDAKSPSVQFLSVARNGLVSNRIPFAAGNLPEVLESEAAPAPGKAQDVSLPVIVNGRINAPGEKDSFRFPGKKGQAVAIEVRARRLGSPLDSRLTLTNGRGEKVAESDDLKDRGEGLVTHQADSGLLFKLPEDGTYTVTLSDTQGKGGPEYAYRLRISPPVPDFELRATPSEVSLPRGGSAALTVHAIRRDGFAGEIRLSIEEPASAGLSLDGAVIPAGADKVRITITASEKAAAGTVFPKVNGTATVEGKACTSPVVPAEELMQAFAYQHLVPAKAQVVTVSETLAPFIVSFQLPPEGCVTLARGKDASLPLKVIRRPGFNGPIRILLMDPPKGITLPRGGALPGRDAGMVLLQAAADTEARPNENLILSAVMMMPQPQSAAAPAAGGTNPAKPADGKGTPPPPAGQEKKPPFQRLIVTLPAVPVRIVGEPETRKAEPGKARRN